MRAEIIAVIKAQRHFDFDTAEIAQLQDRPETTVQTDIEAARQTLRDHLAADGDAQRAGQEASFAARH